MILKHSTHQWRVECLSFWMSRCWHDCRRQNRLKHLLNHVGIFLFWRNLRSPERIRVIRSTSLLCFTVLYRKRPLRNSSLDIRLVEQSESIYCFTVTKWQTPRIILGDSLPTLSLFSDLSSQQRSSWGVSCQCFSDVFSSHLWLLNKIRNQWCHCPSFRETILPKISCHPRFGGKPSGSCQSWSWSDWDKSARHSRMKLDFKRN